MLVLVTVFDFLTFCHLHYNRVLSITGDEQIYDETVSGLSIKCGQCSYRLCTGSYTQNANRVTHMASKKCNKH